MVREQISSRGVNDPLVLKAMLTVPRHVFVPEALQATAYDDRPLPVGQGQTISQPYIVALMSQLLQAAPGQSVLEIGTGSGYQAAVLQAMGLRVYSVERLPELLAQARQRFGELGLPNILTKIADGTLGWPEFAPFDRILVTAGGPGLPEALGEQLAEDGIMIIPVGKNRGQQELVRVGKKHGNLRLSKHGAVSFVDLVGDLGWSAENKPETTPLRWNY